MNRSCWSYWHVPKERAEAPACPKCGEGWKHESGEAAYRAIRSALRAALEPSPPGMFASREDLTRTVEIVQRLVDLAGEAWASLALAAKNGLERVAASEERQDELEGRIAELEDRIGREGTREELDERMEDLEQELDSLRDDVEKRTSMLREDLEDVRSEIADIAREQ